MGRLLEPEKQHGGRGGGGEIVGDGRLKVVACDHLILAFYRSFASSQTEGKTSESWEGDSVRRRDW